MGSSPRSWAQPFAGDGGLYDWIHAAYPHGKWAARASWYYWINFPLWMASLAVMCPELITFITGRSLGTFGSLVVELLFIWIVTLIACYPVCDSIIILNLSAVIKIVLALLVGGLGVWYISKKWLCQRHDGPDLPAVLRLGQPLVYLRHHLQLSGLRGRVHVRRQHARPEKADPAGHRDRRHRHRGHLPLFSAFGIGAAVDVREISVDSGLIDAVSLILGADGGVLVGVVALLFLVTLFGNMISWSMGVNSTAALAADHNDMPRVFAKRWAKNDMPVGAAVTSGVVASCVCVLGVLIEMASPDSSLFWSFFALNLVMLLLSYLPVFPAFLKLRREDAKTPRPFRVPGSDTALKWIAYVPMVLIVISIIFTAVPLSFDAETLASFLPITIGSILSVAIGEVLIALRGKNARS